MIIADVPNPVGVVTDLIGGAAGWAFDKVADGITKWILSAVEFFVNGAVDFLRTSSRPDVEAVWFSGSGSPYATVRDISAVLLLAFIFVGLIQGLIAGDAVGMVRRIAGYLPLAVGGMVVTTQVVAVLLELTDSLSNAVLTNSDDQAIHFLSGFADTVTTTSSGFAAVVLGLVAVMAGLFLWIELIVRSALIYLLVAITPLAFAAALWPAARGVLRKTFELLVAAIASKLVICIAVSIGTAALSGAGTAGVGEGFASDAGASVGTLLVGTVLLGLAAFSPFVVLKLVPIAEAALVAQGVSRGPARATQTGMSTAYSASMLRRVAGSKAVHPAAAAAGVGAAAAGSAKRVVDAASSAAGSRS